MHAPGIPVDERMVKPLAVFWLRRENGPVTLQPNEAQQAVFRILSNNNVAFSPAVHGGNPSQSLSSYWNQSELKNTPWSASCFG